MNDESFIMKPLAFKIKLFSRTCENYFILLNFDNEFKNHDVLLIEIPLYNQLMKIISMKSELI